MEKTHFRVGTLLPGEAPPRKLTWSVTCQGNFVQVRRHSADGRVRWPHERGVIDGYSRQSRRRALQTVARIDWPSCSPAVFVELGYPDEVIEWEHDGRAKQLELWRRRLERDLGRKMPIFWRWEWEIRKSGGYKGFLAPHIHLVIMNTRFIPMDKVNRWWKEVLGWRGFVHTDVRKIVGADGAGRYLTKYLTKSFPLVIVTKPDGFPPNGRAWGLLRRNLVPWAEEMVYPGLPEGEIEWLRSVARASFPWYGKYGEFGFTKLGKRFADELRDKYFSGLDRGKAC